MHSVGFEPTHPKILRPERSALDHSAKNALLYNIYFASDGIRTHASEEN